MYAYVRGNPLRARDFLGLMEFCSPEDPQCGSNGPPNLPRTGVICVTNAFLRNYADMRNANTIGADRYFHCMANCEAARCGRNGTSLACVVSDGREWFDQNIKGDPPQESADDQAANQYGRGWGANTNLPCGFACQPFRPLGLSPGPWYPPYRPLPIVP